LFVGGGERGGVSSWAGCRIPREEGGEVYRECEKRGRKQDTQGGEKRKK